MCHTRDHIRNFRLPVLFREKNLDGKQRDPREVALGKFKQLEATHHPKPLPDDALAELDHILEAAEIEAERIF